MLMWVHKGPLYARFFSFPLGRVGAIQFYGVPDGETSASYIFRRPPPIRRRAIAATPSLHALFCAGRLSRGVI